MSDGLIPAARQVVTIVVGLALVGALAGAVWEWVWTPPQGVAFEGEFVLDLAGLRSDFSGTGLYVVVGVVAGLLAGAVAGFATRRREVLTLVAVTAGAVLAAWVMLRVGVALGPPDPDPIAAAAEDYTPIVSDLRVVGTSPYVALPGGALLGLIATLLGVTRHHRVRPSRDPARR